MLTKNYKLGFFKKLYYMRIFILIAFLAFISLFSCSKDEYDTSVKDSKTEVFLNSKNLSEL